MGNATAKQAPPLLHLFKYAIFEFKMAQKKLFRFGQIKTFKNVLEYPENIKGNWHNFFGNKNPIELELACGRGEYTIGLAAIHLNKNFIGVDIKGNRMYIGAKKHCSIICKMLHFSAPKLKCSIIIFHQGK